MRLFTYLKEKKSTGFHERVLALYPVRVDSNGGSDSSGTRFSKVPVTFRARNQIFKSKYKE